MSIKSDHWIRRMAASHGMIEPFEPGQVRTVDGHRIISYGTSSYGYDVRCAREFKIFTNINSTIVDPKDGILSSANQLSLAPTDGLRAVTGSTEAHGDRAYRIAELLQARGDWTEPELHNVQLDVRSPRLLRWRDAVLAALSTNVESYF